MTDLPECWQYQMWRKEIICPHGVGHPAPWSDKEIHGCDGCCNSEVGGGQHEEWEKAVKAAKELVTNTSGDDQSDRT